MMYQSDMHKSTALGIGTATSTCMPIRPQCMGVDTPMGAPMSMNHLCFNGYGHAHAHPCTWHVHQCATSHNTWHVWVHASVVMYAVRALVPKGAWTRNPPDVRLVLKVVQHPCQLVASLGPMCPVCSDHKAYVRSRSRSSIT